MIYKACIDFPVGTGPVSVPTEVNTTVHAGLYCILEFSCMFSGLNSSPLNPREGLSMDLQGGWMSCSLSLSLQPLAPSFCNSVQILAVLTPFIPPSAQSSQLKNLTGSTCAAPSSPATWKSPTSKCRSWRSEYMWNKSRVSRPTHHLSKCRISLTQCQTSRGSHLLPVFLIGETDSLYIPVVLKLI